MYLEKTAALQPGPEELAGQRSEETMERIMQRLYRGWNHQAFNYYKRLARVKVYVNQNLTEDVCLQKAARVAAMEATSFSRFFKKAVGIGYSTWVTRLRLAHAVALAARSNYSVIELAVAAGFAEKRTLERAFRRHLQTTPGRLRKRIRPCP